MIVVHIPSGKATEPYANYAFAAMQALATDASQLSLRLYDIRNWQHTSPTIDHVKALGEAFAAMRSEPETIHVVCDSDSVIVRRGWDDLTRGLLEQVDCFGTAYDAPGGRNSGNGTKHPYQRNPNVVWMALKPGKPWHHYAPAAPHSQMLTIETPGDSKLWGLPKDYTLLCDACWNFPMFLRGEKLSAMPLPYIATAGMLTGLGPEYDEWHAPDGTPFVVHQGKSRKNRFRETAFSRAFYDRCDELIRPASGTGSPR